MIVWCSILMCETLNCLWGRRYSNSKPRIVLHSALTGSNTFQRYALRHHKHWLWFINHFQRRFSSAVLSYSPVSEPNKLTRSHYACNPIHIIRSNRVHLSNLFIHTLSGRIWWNRYHVSNTKMKKFNFKWTSHVIPLSRPCIHIFIWSEHKIKSIGSCFSGDASRSIHIINVRGNECSPLNSLLTFFSYRTDWANKTTSRRKW